MQYRNTLTYRCLALAMFAMAMSTHCTAQSYVTYNHDSSKQDQITVMETGAGSLSPELYYTLLHNNYKKSAAAKNKLGFRTLAGIGAYQQVEYADSIEAYLKKRAEVEALNVADRQIDLAWRTEGTKIESKLTALQNNINRIIPAGGSVADKQRWEEYYKVYKTAVKSTRDAYMPNAQRKKEYLRIYADLARQNDTLLKMLVMMNNKSKTAQLLAMHNNYRTANRANAATAAFAKWREAGLSIRGQSDTSSDDGSGEERVNR